jgi:DNA-binding response OmpR family regulator
MSLESLKFSDFEKVFPKEESRPKPMQMASSGGLKQRILLAAEDPVHSIEVFQALVDAGYEVVLANEGAQAMGELRRADHPPLAVLDAQLPGLNPADLCQRMRDAGKVIYLIFYSDSPTTPEIVSGIEAGADLWLAQATPLPELVAHVQAGLRLIMQQRTLTQRLETLTGGSTPH